MREKSWKEINKGIIFIMKQNDGRYITADDWLTRISETRKRSAKEERIITRKKMFFKVIKLNFLTFENEKYQNLSRFFLFIKKSLNLKIWWRCERDEDYLNLLSDIQKQATLSLTFHLHTFLRYVKPGQNLFHKNILTH